MSEKRPEEVIRNDVVVIGAGSAGISFALQVADKGIQVDLYTKEAVPFEYPESSSSILLAGGYAAVPFEGGIPSCGDSFDKHVADTLAVGGGLNSKRAVRYFIRNFPYVIRWLEKRGIRFDKDLHIEGSHSANRVYHVSDRTGQTVMEKLGKLVLSHPNITVHANHMALDLISQNKICGEARKLDSCLGAYILDAEANVVKTVAANALVVAAGGLGKVFMYTTNPDTASGDGYAMCYRVGLPLVNMEFVQFHPTVYYDPDTLHESERRVLFTEALRGAGAFLKLDRNGTEDFVLKYDSRGSRASRDVVTRAQDTEMKRLGLDHVWLDCTPIEEEYLKISFRGFYEFCLAKGIDPTREPVPVVYAAHYSNGGVWVDCDGKTIYPDGSGMKNLYVVGETAYTGLHGATRLASNSGPEAIAMALSAARHFLRQYEGKPVARRIPLWDPGDAKVSQEKEKVEEYWDGTRIAMTKRCGVARNEDGLLQGLSEIEDFRRRLDRYYWSYLVESDTLEARNIQDVAFLILTSALFRRETRACHARMDYPETDPRLTAWTVVQKGRSPYLLPIVESEASVGSPVDLSDLE